MKIRLCLVVFLVFLFAGSIKAQKNKTVIHIVHADRADYDDRLGKDIQRLIGNVVLRQDSSYFYSDSAYLNDKTRWFEGFGNVHVEVNDSIDIYGRRLKYNGETRFAEVFDDVVMRDDSTVLRTDYLTYDRIGHLASYPHHGIITRNEKQLVSEKGYYRDDIKVFYFRKDVVVTMPDYKMLSDTLTYDTKIETMHFFGPTTIINEDNILKGNYGWYDANADIAFLDKKAVLMNKEQSISSDSMYYSRSVGFTKAMSDVVMHDTLNKAVVNGEYAELWSKKGYGFVTDSLETFYYADRDTLFMHSDSLYFYFDTLTNDLLRVKSFYNVRFYRADIQGKCDSLDYLVADSSARLRRDPVLWSRDSQMTGDSINIVVKNNAIDSVLMTPNAFIIQQDSIKGFNQIKGKLIVAYFENDELDRIFNDGNAETIYWLREDDGSLIGINSSQSVSMIITVVKNQIQRIKYFQKTDEILYPEEKLPEGKDLLKGFLWQDELRPKDKTDIFRKPVIPSDNTDDNPKKRRRR